MLVGGDVSIALSVPCTFPSCHANGVRHDSSPGGNAFQTECTSVAIHYKTAKFLCLLVGFFFVFVFVFVFFTGRRVFVCLFLNRVECKIDLREKCGMVVF